MMGGGLAGGHGVGNVDMLRPAAEPLARGSVPDLMVPPPLGLHEAARMSEWWPAVGPPHFCWCLSCVHGLCHEGADASNKHIWL